MLRGDVNESRKLYRLNVSFLIIIYCVFLLYFDCDICFNVHGIAC